MGLGILEPLVSCLGLMKSYDSQDKANSTVKNVKLKPELHFCMQTDDAAWGYKQGPPKLQSEVSSVEWTAAEALFPTGTPDCC